MVRVPDNMRVRLVLAVALMLALAAGVVALSAGATQRTSNGLAPLGVAAPNVNGPTPPLIVSVSE